MKKLLSETELMSSMVSSRCNDAIQYQNKQQSMEVLRTELRSGPQRSRRANCRTATHGPGCECGREQTRGKVCKSHWHEQIARHLAAVPALITRPEHEQRRLHLTAGIALPERPGSHRLFVLIDQFEETFTLCKDEVARAKFIDHILWATSAARGRTTVLTMRSDFLLAMRRYPGLHAAVQENIKRLVPEPPSAFFSLAQAAGAKRVLGKQYGQVEDVEYPKYFRWRSTRTRLRKLHRRVSSQKNAWSSYIQ
jgi:hypothetical protein